MVDFLMDLNLCWRPFTLSSNASKFVKIGQDRKFIHLLGELDSATGFDFTTSSSGTSGLVEIGSVSE